MIVILEGAERTGKSTIARMLERKGFIYIKDVVRPINGNIEFLDADKTTHRIDAMLNFIIKLSETNENIVIDRFHISNAVFADNSFYRDDRYVETYVKFYDTILSLLNTKLCLFERFVDEEYLKEHPVLDTIEELEYLVDKFRYFYDKSEIKDKMIFDIGKDNPEYILDYIMEDYPFDEDEEPDEKIIASHVMTRDPEPVEEEKYDFYLASPFFNPEQVERMNKVLNILRRYNYKVYAPMEHGVVKADDTKEFANLVFKENCRAINNSLKVIAITDGKDMGTIWEAGYAYGRGIPVVYYAETLGDNPFNLMLAESGIGIYKSGFTLDASAFTHNFEFKDGVKYE